MSLLANQHPEPAEEEEDISRAGVYHDEPAPSGKGKGKQRAENPFEDDDGESTDEEDEETGEKGYPPVNDEDAEARRVAETLQRWEMAERQRRKVARESTSTSASASTSLVGEVTRSTSLRLLWPGRRRSKQQAPPEGPGQHHQLRTSEDGVALDDMDTRLSAPPTPEPDNPFMTPAASTVSLNAPEGSAIMHESDSDPSKGKAARKSSVLRQHPPPPPQPLDLPAPRSPPPRTETPHTDRPPEPIAPPAVAHHELEPEPELPPKRWWTDWLCGCREGGDHQAGRTNPFE